MSVNWFSSTFEANIRPRLSYWKQKIVFCFPIYRISLSKAVEAIGSPIHCDSAQFIYLVRDWVNINSVHLIDEEHDSYAFHVPETIRRLQLKNNGRGSRPHLSCGPRAYAMKEILARYHYQSRIIDIFEITKGQLPRVLSHTLIEVYDSSLSKWVLQDPDFNVSYVSKNGVPVSAAEALQFNTEELKYETNGFEVENQINLDNTINRLFDCLILYRTSYEGRRSTILFKSNDKSALSTIVQLKGRSATFKDYLQAKDASIQFK